MSGRRAPAPACVQSGGSPFLRAAHCSLQEAAPPTSRLTHPGPCCVRRYYGLSDERRAALPELAAPAVEALCPLVAADPDEGVEEVLALEAQPAVLALVDCCCRYGLPACLPSRGGGGPAARGAAHMSLQILWGASLQRVVCRAAACTEPRRLP